MKVFDDISRVSPDSPTAVTIGKFDGLHRGHGKLLQALREEKKKGLTTVVISFRLLDSDGKPKPQIFTRSEFLSILQRFDVDILICLALTPEIRDMEAEDFLRDMLLGQLRMQTLIAGEFFSFGKNCVGNVTFLRDASERYGFTLRAFRNIMTDRENKFSSTAVRAFLADGKIAEAKKMLGRSYFVQGTVVHGHHIGTGMGFPTLNVKPEPGKLYPKEGVYAVRVRLRGRFYKGMANLGRRPTVSDETDVLLEVNVFDFSGDVYGCPVTVYFCGYIRGTERFGSIEELSDQLSADREKVRDFFRA